MLELSHLFTLTVEIDGLHVAGNTPVGEVRLIPFSKGRFEGPELSGKVLPGGSDWQQVRNDGVVELRAHYLLETDQGEVIEVSSEGLYATSSEALARAARGEQLAPSEVYFRTHVRFRTAAPRIAYLNSLLAVSQAEIHGMGVRLQMFRLS